VLPGDYPYLSGVPLTVGPAQPAALPAPAVATIADRRDGDRREITVHVGSQRSVRLLAVEVRTAAGRVAGARVNGSAVAATALGSDRLMVTFHGAPAAGLELTFTVTGSGPVDVRAVDGSDGLAGLPGFRPRPPDVQGAGSHAADLVLVGHTVHLG
jgi:hypothetical protein